MTKVKFEGIPFAIRQTGTFIRSRLYDVIWYSPDLKLCDAVVFYSLKYSAKESYSLFHVNMFCFGFHFYFHSAVANMALSITRRPRFDSWMGRELPKSTSHMHVVFFEVICWTIFNYSIHGDGFVILVFPVLYRIFKKNK